MSNYNEKLDIGNVRGIQGEKGEKGDKGNTPTFEELKYARDSGTGEYITIKGSGGNTLHYLDVDGNLCDEEGHILDENYDPTNEIGTPFDESEYGYLYKPVYVDSEGHYTNENNDLINEDGTVKYAESTFLTEIANAIYNEENVRNQLIRDIAPYILNAFLTANPNDSTFEAFFNELEGDIKYYICADNPYTHIYVENNIVVNNCRYKDEEGNIVRNSNNEVVYVPLEKNALYLYNDGVDNNDVMHYDIYVCVRAGSVPKKIVSSSDFSVNYNVIDELTLTESLNNDGETDVYLNILTRGTRGQFYSIDDVDTLFDNNVISRLGANNGIAQLNSSGKVPSSQLPSYVDDVIEGTMNSGGTTFTPSNNNYVGSVTETGKIYLDTTTRKTYRYTGSAYVEISNPVEDSGWTTLSVNSNFYNYTENSVAVLPLQYRKFGSLVQVVGLVGLNANLTNGQWTIGTLPSGFRPAKEMSYVSELHNNSNMWTCIVKTNGDITFNRLRDINSSVDVTVTYTNSNTETVSLAKATSYITGTQWVDILKINAIFFID